MWSVGVEWNRVGMSIVETISFSTPGGSTNRDKACLEDIIQSMRSVVVCMGTLTVDEFIKNELVSHAVERCLEIVGEATKRLSIQVRDSQPQIPWRKMAGMRDVLIYGYDAIDLNLIHSVATQLIPPLIPMIEAILAGLPDDPSATLPA